MKTKQNALIKSEALMVYAGELETHTNHLREQYAKQFGRLVSFNQYPVSGGICDHWHTFAKEAVLELVHLKQEIEGESLKLWREAGRRSHTWRKHKDNLRSDRLAKQPA